MKQSSIISVTSESEFELDDASHLFEGAVIGVHSDDYARDNLQSTILTIVGNVITLDEPLDFLPLVGDKVESRSLADADAYLFL
jgi:hypothetical protein